MGSSIAQSSAAKNYAATGAMAVVVPFLNIDDIEGPGRVSIRRQGGVASSDLIIIG